MSGIINYISSWFKSDKPKDANTTKDDLTVKGIQQKAEKIDINDIKPFNYDESSELDLNQIIFVDSMKSDINDLTLNTSTDSSLNMSPNQELTDSSENNKQSISDNKDNNEDNKNNNNQINLQQNQFQIIPDVSETEKMIDRIMKNATTETMTGGNYRTKYNKNNYRMNGGGNEYCGKVNKQVYDYHKIDLGKY